MYSACLSIWLCNLDCMLLQKKANRKNGDCRLCLWPAKLESLLQMKGLACSLFFSCSPGRSVCLSPKWPVGWLGECVGQDTAAQGNINLLLKKLWLGWISNRLVLLELLFLVISAIQRGLTLQVNGRGPSYFSINHLAH
jgi:hypothetical protein